MISSLSNACHPLLTRCLRRALTAAVAFCLAGGAAVHAEGLALSERSIAENNFISALKGWPDTPTDEWPDINLADAERFGDGLLRHPGKIYHIPQVNSATYFIDNDEGLILMLFDPDYPAESIANLFLLHLAEASETPLELNVLTHEYGSKSNLSTTVERLVSYCEASGCETFFGVERLEDSTMECSLFFYNPREGYDHVLRVDCNPRDVIENQAPITGRLSLFVPTGNVESLFQQRPTGISDARRYIDREGVEYDD